MRIKRLFVRNFGSFGDYETRVDCRDRTFIVGRNNHGKSTLAVDALLWALTGRCRGLDGKGAGVEQLAGTLDAPMAVRVDLDGVGSFQRVYHAGKIAIESSKFTGPASAQQAALYAALGTSEGVLRAVLDSAAFLDLAHVDAKELLMGVLDVRVKLSAEDHRALAVRKLAGLEIPPEGLTLGELEGLYKRTFEARAVAKKTAAGIAIPPKPEQDAPPRGPAELDSKLAALREEEKRLIAALATDTGRRGALEFARKAAETRRGKLQSVDTLRDLVARNRTRIAELRADRALLPVDPPAPGRLVDATGRLTVLQSRIDGIATPGKTCVLDALIPCKTPAKEFKAALDKLAAELAEQQAAVDALVAEQQAGAAARDCERAIADTERALAAAEEALATRLLLDEEIAKLDVEIAALPTGAEPPELATLRERIRKGEAVVREARDLTARHAAHTQATERRAHADAEVAALNRLTDEVLGPKGLRVAALDAAIGRFEKLINGALGRFGYVLKFQLDPWTVLVNGRPATRLSVSERLRVGLSLQLALATVTGLHVAAIDAIDLLDAGNRRIFAEVVAEWPGQLILAATRDSAATAPRSTSTVAVYWVELDGAYSRVGLLDTVGAPV